MYIDGHPSYNPHMVTADQTLHSNKHRISYLQIVHFNTEKKKKELKYKVVTQVGILVQAFELG